MFAIVAVFFQGDRFVNRTAPVLGPSTYPRSHSSSAIDDDSLDSESVSSHGNVTDEADFGVGLTTADDSTLVRTIS